ncbi:MAG: alpha-L-arabinofuranosidase [Lachnospiraceae bacterium]|nr:alpha-L-arabinofuranosidase [Lachnospiraceae bacterium]
MLQVNTNEFDKKLAAYYPMNDASNPGKDCSGNGNDAIVSGTTLPTVSDVCGRQATTFAGGAHGTSYFEIPSSVLKDVSDATGITVATWINLKKGTSVWERIIDLGNGAGSDNLFITRNLRGVCFHTGDLSADPGKALPEGEWIHIAMTVCGTKGGTLSSAGPIIYVNGEVAANGLISQTSSGTYLKLRGWFASLEKYADNYKNNYIGMSQYDADDDLNASMCDFRIYSDVLESDEIIKLMCTSLSDEQLVNLALDKYLPVFPKLALNDFVLPTSLMAGKINVSWKSDNPSIITNDGKVLDTDTASLVTLTATLTLDNITKTKSFSLTVVPKDVAPYTLNINGNDEVLDISKYLWGLFYEDINNAADGGIYAEMIQNRSFEAFTYDTYDFRSGENGVSTGRNRNPLFAWFGDTDKMTPCCEGGLNEYFGITVPDVNNYYVKINDGATIFNRGFCDSNNACSMNLIAGDSYDFTIWAKSENGATITLTFADNNANAASESVSINVEAGNTWKKYGVDSKIVLTSNTTCLGQLKLEFAGDVAIDMVSLFPQKVWGATEETTSASAHKNYVGNKNYRLRRDLVEALVDLHPTFLRFPGGCISEGSYIWENVYDWKESVGDVEVRKENFNVWGYMMTMGLGYMEYFQLAEDLNASPLPVMACGVLCQARSDYANPAGGKLQDKYIKNFTDLIDFAISTDFENNEWAKLRKYMGHEAPFDLHLLGVGNENWGPEFMASFEIFYERITKYMEVNYPGYDLEIISTVGAQADDDAYKFGWKFLAGDMTGTAKVAFTDGETSTEEEVSWYKYQKHFMETIADEHYYRSNQYLLNNVDRYNYYYRAYNANGTINDAESSKVFVGEYASTDKNSLAGAVAEAAVMTGFENNSDVVRLAATAPLFNKVLTDGTYRWTPDCIWFDDEKVWKTPTYYVQQLFAKYVGTKLLSTSFKTYENGKLVDLIPHGGVSVSAKNGKILLKSVKVISNTDGSVLIDADFTKGMPAEFEVYANGSATGTADGLILEGTAESYSTVYTPNFDASNYKVEVNATKLSGIDGFYVGTMVTNIGTAYKNAIEYAIGMNDDTTGVKVYKEGIEGYTLGDFSSSICAGNLRSARFEEVLTNKEYIITVDAGSSTGKNLVCGYRAADNSFTSKILDYKLEAYNNYVFNSVTKDDSHVYIKLVNADDFTKNTKLTLSSLNANSDAKVVTITADPSLAHVANVNEKNNEPVVPVESSITFTNNEAVISLPAYSVTCIILDI